MASILNMKTPEEHKKRIFDKWQKWREKTGKGLTTTEGLEAEYKRRLASTLRNNEAPFRYITATWDDIPEEIHKYVEEDFSQESKSGIYLWGGVGVGKTHTLYAIKDYWHYAMVRVRVLNFSNLLFEIKQSFNSKNPQDILSLCGLAESPLIGGVACSHPSDRGGTDLLCIDDIGAEKDSEWAGEQLYRLVDHIYEEQESFVFTSNYSLGQLAKRFGNIQGDRIASRIAEMAEVVELKGKDRRV